MPESSAAVAAGPSVSVIICCDGRVDRLDQAIQSVLAQGRDDIEILVVDVASADPTAQHLFASYQRPFTRVVRLTDPGLVRARNAALNEARGEHVCFLEPDGELAPVFLARTLAAIGDDADLACVLCGESRHDGIVIRSPADCSVAQLVTFGSSHPSGIFRRAPLRDVGGFDETAPSSAYHVVEVAIRLLDAGRRCDVIPDPLYRAGRRDDLRDDSPEALAHIIHKHAERFQADWPELVRTLSEETSATLSSATSVAARSPDGGPFERAARGVLGSRIWRAANRLRGAVVSVRGALRRASSDPAAISLVVTCTDDARAVTATIDGAWSQAGPSADVILVANGVSDPVVMQLLEWYEEAGALLIRLGGVDPAAARSQGLQQARGDVVWAIDAGDEIAAGAISAALQAFASSPDLAWVVGALVHRDTGFTWRPAGTSVAALAGASRGAFPVVSRSALQQVGGYDGAMGLVAAADWDLRLRLSASGLVGEVLNAPFVVTASPGLDGSVDPVIRKNPRIIDGVVADVVIAHASTLQQARGFVEAPAVVKTDSGQVQPIDWGGLRRLEPVSAVWGFDRGLPVDRHYIHRFLDRSREDIRGRVLEVKDDGYARQFGSAVTAVDVVDIASNNPAATIVSDLSAPNALPRDSFDCFILTQTIHEIRDVPAVLANAFAALRPGGVLLTTVPCVSRIDYEAGVPGDWWRFTPAAARHLWTEAFGERQVEIEACGNVLTCVSFLMGIAADDLTEAELEHCDQYFPLLLCIRAVKGPARESTVVPPAHARRTQDVPSGAVLMYHRVADLQPDTSRLCVSPATFRRQMETLRAEHDPVSLKEFGLRAAAGELSPETVAVTFDDGFLDNLTHALPILVEFAIPATVFVAGGTAEGGTEYYWDVIERIFCSTPLPPSFDLNNDGKVIVPTVTVPERDAAHHMVRDEMLVMSARERHARLVRLLEWGRVSREPRDSHRRMTDDEIRVLASSPGISIGAHTTNHLFLPRQPEGVQLSEIHGNRRYLTELTGRVVDSFSYPYGAVSDMAESIVVNAGFALAVTVEAGVGGESRRYRMPRHEIRDSDGSFAIAVRKHHHPD